MSLYRTLPPSNPRGNRRRCAHLPILDRFSTSDVDRSRRTDRTQRSTNQRSPVEMTITHRITTAAAVILSLAAAGAPAASARPIGADPVSSAANAGPAAVYSRPDKALVPVASPAAARSNTSVPPILPTIKASQLATIEQAARHAAAYAPPKRSQYSNAETNAYRVAASRHSTPGVVAVATPQTGFDWGDAGIGAAAGFVLAMLSLGGALVIAQRRPRRSRHTTALPG
jgi:hypothetical protein